MLIDDSLSVPIAKHGYNAKREKSNSGANCREVATICIESGYATAPISAFGAAEEKIAGSREISAAR